GDVYRVRAVRGAGGPHLTHPAPGLGAVVELLVEDPPVPGVADRVQSCLPGGDVVGLVQRATAPARAEVVRDHDVGTVLADHGRDLPAQWHTVLQDPVRQPEELDPVHADDPRGLDLLGGADLAALVRGHAVDAGFAAGRHAVDDRLALSGPPGDRGRGTELHVVRMRDDSKCCLPALVDGDEGLWGVHDNILGTPDAIGERLRGARGTGPRRADVPAPPRRSLHSADRRLTTVATV